MHNTDHSAHTALASTPDAQALGRAFPNPAYARKPIVAHTAAQAVMVRDLIGSLADVELQHLEN